MTNPPANKPTITSENGTKKTNVQSGHPFPIFTDKTGVKQISDKSKQIQRVYVKFFSEFLNASFVKLTLYIKPLSPNVLKAKNREEQAKITYAKYKRTFAQTGGHIFSDVATTRGNVDTKHIKTTATILKIKFCSADFVKLLKRQTMLVITKTE